MAKLKESTEARIVSSLVFLGSFLAVAALLWVGLMTTAASGCVGSYELCAPVLNDTPEPLLASDPLGWALILGASLVFTLGLRRFLLR